MLVNVSIVGVSWVIDNFYGFTSECRIDGLNYLPISQWIAQEFSPDDASHITKKMSDWSFFKSYEKNGLNKLEFLEFLEKSLKAKKDINIYELVVDKLKQIAPTEYGCDPELYATDTYYRVWFALRESFFSVLSSTLEQPNGGYFVWGALSDNHSHQDCLDLHNKVFDVDMSFMAIAEQHWLNVRSGCRCDLSLLNDQQLEKRNLKAP